MSAASTLDIEFVMGEEVDVKIHPSSAALLRALPTEPSDKTRDELFDILQIKTGFSNKVVTTGLPEVLK